MRSLSMLVHGQSKVGKTWLADTAPAPRLVLDAEGGNRFTSSRKYTDENGRSEWNPAMHAPPAADGTWDTCVVYVRDFATVQAVYTWLSAGQHPFKSVVVDSISEVQQRCVDGMVGTDPMKQQNWGDLLRQMSDLVRKMRDLTIHPTNPLEAVILIAMTRQDRETGRFSPYVQGQLATTLPYYIDVTGYLFVERVDGATVRRLLVSAHPQYEAGDRTGRLPEVVDSPTVTSLLDAVFGPNNNNEEKK
jgi:hypothetical protein